MQQFSSTVLSINGWQVIRLPLAVSQTFPSRGMVMAQGMVNDQPLSAPLEPDGNSSHWFKTELPVGTAVDVTIEPSRTWPEPVIPADIQTVLRSKPAINDTWQSLTPMARWDWLRWISATANPATRQKRIGVALDKMRKGSRRPCCFNRSMCTVPEVSKNGVLQAV